MRLYKNVRQPLAQRKPRRPAEALDQRSITVPGGLAEPGKPLGRALAGKQIVDDPDRRLSRKQTVDKTSPYKATAASHQIAIVHVRFGGASGMLYDLARNVDLGNV